MKPIYGSPLKKCWKPDMVDEPSNYLIVINDDKKRDQFILNYIFSMIHKYTFDKSSNKSYQLYLFWKSVRFFIENKHKSILNNNCDDLRIILLSSNIYNFASYQEKLIYEFIV